MVGLKAIQNACFHEQNSWKHALLPVSGNYLPFLASKPAIDMHGFL
jgi:hypothetical protein